MNKSSLFLSVLPAVTGLCAGEVDMARLDAFAKSMLEVRENTMGYPINQDVDLRTFYDWYLESGLHAASMNNVGDPQGNSPYRLNTHEFEREVIDFFAPLYGFEPDEAWGLVTSGGTDGNNHGIYFGVKYLLAKTQMRPILYVSEEAHYSIKKLGDLQNIEMRLIPADVMGHMDIAQFEALLVTDRPALIVAAVGTTFKGAIDNQEAIDEVLRRKPPIATYRHLDAALFGGYLAFTDHNWIVNRKKVKFDSIAVSGHKFFGFDEPCGFFITTKAVLAELNPARVAYLNAAVPTTSCSRSALSPLKFWWKIQRVEIEGFRQQAGRVLANADYFKTRLDEAGYPAWKNPCSNTVFFKRPSPSMLERYDLAQEYDERLGGELAHMIVMQNESREEIDRLVADLKAETSR